MHKNSINQWFYRNVGGYRPRKCLILSETNWHKIWQKSLNLVSVFTWPDHFKNIIKLIPPDANTSEIDLIKSGLSFAHSPSLFTNNPPKLKK
jgi:hypothetical protein